MFPRWRSQFNASMMRLFWTAALCMIIASSKRAQSVKIEALARDQNDGWRPIVGRTAEPLNAPFQDEITHYRNPASRKADPVKAEKEEPMMKKSSPSGPTKLTPPGAKPLFVIPNIGMHIVPLSGSAIAGLHHPPRPHKFNHLLKIHQHPTLGGKPVRPKPLRHQVPAFSTRDEVFLPAPSSNIGPYTFYSASQAALKPPINPIRPTTHSHIEFANHFPIPNTDDELYQIVREPVHQYVIPHHSKTPLTNDVHYTFQNPEDYNRHTPASTPYKFESGKHNASVKSKKEKTQIKVHPFLINTPQPQGLAGQNKVDVQITKEKLKVFHNAIPPIYSPLEEIDFRQLKATPPPFRHPVAYEVTEGKWNQDTPVFQYHFANPVVIPASNTLRLPSLPPRVITEESKPFLPTPVKPDSIVPTLPTDGEIATIYGQVKSHRLRIQNPDTLNNFDVKEVSTHFPIIGTPEVQTVYPSRFQVHRDEDNEITTKSTETIEPPVIGTTTIPFLPGTRKPNRQRRPNRRRRPSSTTTEVGEIMEVDGPTEAYQAPKFEIATESVVTTSRPTRVRPTRLRTIPPSSLATKEYQLEEVTIPARPRYRRPRPTTTEEPKLHESLEDKFARLTTTTEKEFPANFESHFTTPFKSELPIDEQSTEEVFKINKQYSDPPNRGGGVDRFKSQIDEGEGGEDPEPDPDTEEVSAGMADLRNEEDEKTLDEDLRTQIHSDDVGKYGIAHTPGNEVDFSTKTEGRHETDTEASTTPYVTIVAQTVPTTITTTTTMVPLPTDASTSELPKRIRGRPIKYDSSSRPRFSVKDYRQRITAITPSTTSTSTSDAPARIQSEVMRLRFPNRSRRPITMSSTTTTTTAPVVAAETNERAKFQPHHPRHPNLDSATEKLKFNTVNTRIRPFARFKATTEPTSTTMKVSIKPNLFANFRRPTPISLRTRILSRQRNSTTIRPGATTLQNSAGEEVNNEGAQAEAVETTIPYSIDEAEVAEVRFDARKVGVDPVTEIQNEDVSKQDDFVQSQIVSELTSSLQNDYNTPGLFKNVQPISRKVPSYFMLATDDPILPIEAFFPKLKDKQR